MLVTVSATDVYFIRTARLCQSDNSLIVRLREFSVKCGENYDISDHRKSS